MRKRVLVVPAVQDLASFAELVGHLGHYMGHVQLDRIVVIVDEQLLTEAMAWLEAPALPAAFDQRTLTRVRDLGDSLMVRPWPCDLRVLAMTSDVILDWDVRRTTLEPWASVASGYRRNRTHFEVDWRGTRLGAAWFAEAAKVLGLGRGFHRQGVSRLAELVGALGGARRAYLVATGPSARSALDRDLSDGVRIACNTVVLDDELMDHVRPNVLTFADPIFHFGPSTYAQRFQRAVAEQAQRHDFWIVTTERYAPLLRHHVPEVHERVIGLRQGSQAWPDNYDLLTHPAVRPYPNVLTMLMLPIAATLARSIGLIGFDGRDPSDDYFWKHGTTVQFGSEAQDIRDVHPGFFDLDYEDYYSTHVTALDRMVGRLESRGVQIESLAPSHMLPLRRRMRREGALRFHEREAVPAIVSVSPDWADDFGHFGPFERRIRHAATSTGLAYVALAGASLHAPDVWAVPTFTDPTFPHGERLAPVGGDRFEAQLAAGLSGLELQPGSAVAFYTADIWHLPSILSVARDHPTARFVVNLMRAHPCIDDALRGSNPWVDALVRLLKASLDAAMGTNVVVTVDTHALARDVAVLVGMDVPVWPMVTVSDPSLMFAPGDYRSDAVHVVSPVHAQQAKGFPELVQLAEQCRGKLTRGEMRFTARFAPQSTVVPDELHRLAERFEASGGRLERSNLTDEGFAALIASADVVLIPYRVRPFRTRTSGVLLDALLAGKPVVAVRGTWAGDLVAQHGAGLTYAEGDVDELAGAIEQVITRIDSYRERAAASRAAIATEYSPSRLVQFLQPQADGLSARIPRESDVLLVREIASQMRSLHSWRAAGESSVQLAAAIREDDRQRQTDRHLDVTENLRRAVAWRDRKLERTKSKVVVSSRLTEHTYVRDAHAHLDEMELLADLVDPHGDKPGLMVDVGAHRGSALTKLLDRGWHVLAFEPDERQAAYLGERFGQDERVTIDTRAVAEAGGQELTFYVSDESTGISGLSAFHESHRPVGSVKTVALRDVLDERSVGVLKIDTEGYDLRVLEGFPWEAQKPDAILCEFEDRKTKPLGYAFDDLAGYLVERGYQVWVSEWHPVIRYGIRHDWHRLHPYPSRLSTAEAWGNLIAFLVPRKEPEIARALARFVQADGAPNTTEPTDERQFAKVTGSRATTTNGRNVSRPTDAQQMEGSRMGRRRLKRSRKAAVAKALGGPLLGALTATMILTAIAFGLALIRQAALAIAVTALAIGALSGGVLVVAVRLERRV